jgi:hypothetical protein
MRLRCVRNDDGLAIDHGADGCSPCAEPDNLAVDRFAKLSFHLCAYERENCAHGERNIRVSGQLQHAQRMLRLFIAPRISGDHGDAEHFNLRRLQQRKNRHLIGAAGP